MTYLKLLRFHSTAVAAALLLSAGARVGFAHGDLHEQIVGITREIEKQPKDINLYLRRASLHQAHQSWDLAMADIQRVERMSNPWPAVHYLRAHLFLDVGWYESAVISATRYLEHEPHHAESLVTRARAQVKLGQYLPAAEDYWRVITNSPTPAPELYIERAQALSAEGVGQYAAALEGLEHGLQRLGPLVTLQLAAIDAELQRKQVDAALARLDKTMAQFPRKETWLVRRGEILQRAGRNQEAVEAYRAALKAWNTLPPTRRAVPAMVELEQTISRALSELGAAGGK